MITFLTLAAIWYQLLTFNIIAKLSPSPSPSPAGGWDSLILTAVGNHPTPYTIPARKHLFYRRAFELKKKNLARDIFFLAQMLPNLDVQRDFYFLSHMRKKVFISPQNLFLLLCWCQIFLVIWANNKKINMYTIFSRMFQERFKGLSMIGSLATKL